MKRTLFFACVICVICGLSLTGCTGHAESFTAGMATGSAVTHTLEGAQADLNERQAALIAQRNQILDQLESANSDAEKLALQAKVNALEKQLEQTAAISTGVQIADKAVGTDWTDPTVVAPWLLALIGAGYGAVTDKKQRSVSKLLTAVNEGVEKFKAQNDPQTAEALYTTIKERKQINGVK